MPVGDRVGQHEHNLGDHPQHQHPGVLHLFLEQLPYPDDEQRRAPRHELPSDQPDGLRDAVEDVTRGQGEHLRFEWAAGQVVDQHAHGIGESAACRRTVVAEGRRGRRPDWDVKVLCRRHQDDPGGDRQVARAGQHRPVGGFDRVEEHRQQHEHRQVVAETESIDDGRCPVSGGVPGLVPGDEQVKHQRYIECVERVQLGDAGLVPQPG